MSEKDLPAKYGVPKALLSTLLMIEKLVDALDKRTNVKRSKLNTGNNEMVDKASVRQLLQRWKERNNITFKTQGIPNQLHQTPDMRGGKWLC